MAAIDPLFAQWLQGVPLWATRDHVGAKARWGDRALTSERPTGIAGRADAEAEGDRELAFFAKGPFAVDDIQVLGTNYHRDIGRVVTVAAGQLGYGAATDVFVMEVEVSRSTGLSTLTVLVPLADLA